jgi:cobalamin synthase
MFKTEESKIALVILLTFAVLLVTGVYPQYVMWMTIAVIALLIVLAIFAVLSKKRYGEPQDERSAKCSLMASRNGLIMAMVLIALLGVAVKLGSTMSIDSLVQTVWGLSVATYFLSYLAYKRFGLA